MTQKDAVYSAVTSVFSQECIHFQSGVTNASSLLTKELRAHVSAILHTGFTSGSIELESKFDTEVQLRNYISGLVSNWLRKDSRLNGGSTVAKVTRPTHNDDPQLKALRKLLANTTDAAKREEIQHFIHARHIELA